MVLIAMGALVLGFVTVCRHYGDVRTRLRDPGGGYAVVRGPVVLFVSALDDATAEALRYVRAIAGERLPGDPRGRSRRHQRHRPGLARVLRRRRPGAHHAAARADGLRHRGPLRAGDRARARRGHDARRARAVQAPLRCSPSCAAARRSRCACACRARRTSCWPTCPWWPTRTASRHPPPVEQKHDRAAADLGAQRRLAARPRLRARARFRERVRAARRARGRRRLADASGPGRRGPCRSRSRSCRRPTATSDSRC